MAEGNTWLHCTWHTTDQAKIEKLLETANCQKFKSPYSSFNSGLDYTGK